MPDRVPVRGRPSVRHNDGTNATVEAVRFGIKGAQAKSKASAVAVHNGGSARGYLGVGGASQQSRYGLLDDRLFCIFIHRHPWGECTHLPRTGSSVAGRQDLGRTTWSVDLVRVGADGSPHWLRVWPNPEEHPRHAGLELWMAGHGYQIVSKPASWFDQCPDESD